MLHIARKVGEAIIIDNNVRLVVTGVSGNKVKLAFEADDHIPIYREELIKRGNVNA